MSTDSPISIEPSSAPSATSVRCARLTRGLRKVGTAFAIASTPVSALQPEAKALSSSRTPTLAAACAAGCVGSVSGCERIRPTRMTAKIATMNTTVGTIITFADSATPYRLIAVISTSASTHSHTVAPYRPGNAEVSAATPAETETATLST
jgi:hypothetical protein